MEHECLFSGAFSLDRGVVAVATPRSECKDVARALVEAAQPPVTLLLRNGDPLVVVGAGAAAGGGVIAKPGLLHLLSVLRVDLSTALAGARTAWDAPRAPFVIVLGVLPTGATLTAMDVSAMDAATVIDAVAGNLEVAASQLLFAPARDFIFGSMAKGGRVRPGKRPHTPVSSADGDGTTAAPATPAELMALEPSQLAWPLPWEDIATYGWAKSLALWHAKSAFCGSCGAPTVAVEGGVKKVCTRSGGDSPCGESVYPRTDPVVISLIQAAGGDAILLGRQPAFPPKYYSCLAGFLEGGESVEEAVRREVSVPSPLPTHAHTPPPPPPLPPTAAAGTRRSGRAHRVRAVLRQSGGCLRCHVHHDTIAPPTAVRARAALAHRSRHVWSSHDRLPGHRGAAQRRTADHRQE